MALNTSKFNHLTPLRFKGLKYVSMVVKFVDIRSANAGFQNRPALMCFAAYIHIVLKSSLPGVRCTSP